MTEKAPGSDPAYPPGGAPPPAYPGPPQEGYPPQQGYPPPQQQGYPPPQQQGYPPQGPGPTVVSSQPTTTVITSTVVHYGDRPVTTTCPNCHNHVTSNVNREMGGLVWLIAAILCIFGLWPCCLIPFCITDLYDARHTCPVCQYHLGDSRKL